MNIILKIRIKFKKYIGWLIIGIIAWYFWQTLSSNWNQVSQLKIKFGPSTLLAVFLHAFSVFISGFLWGETFYLTTKIKIPLLESVRAHCAAWILKYIPGQVGAYLYKLRWGKNKGASKALTSLAFLYDFLFLLFASTLPIVPIVFLGSASTNMGPPMLAAYVLCLSSIFIVTNKRSAESIQNLIKKISGKKFENIQPLALGSLIRMVLLYSLPRVTNAIGFIVISSSLLSLGIEDYVTLGAIYVLAGIIGILAVFVPSGIGVREGIIVILSSSIISVEEAIVLSLLARLYATAADALVATLYLVLLKNGWNWRVH